MRKFLIICLSLVAFSCSKEDSDVQELGYDYYPVIVGKYVTYNVEHYVYNDFDTTIDTSIYQLKEVIDSAYLDLEGRTVYQLKRLSRVSDTLPWSLIQDWSFYKDKERLEINESNAVFVKMAFPLRRAKTWDGNSRNSL